MSKQTISFHGVVYTSTEDGNHGLGNTLMDRLSIADEVPLSSSKIVKLKTPAKAGIPEITP